MKPEIMGRFLPEEDKTLLEYLCPHFLRVVFAPSE